VNPLPIIAIEKPFDRAVTYNDGVRFFWWGAMNIVWDKNRWRQGW
jgi:hypothetical protein